MKEIKDWKERFGKEFKHQLEMETCNLDWWNFQTRKDIENFIDQIISERDKEWDKWKVLAEAMDNAPVGHRVTIKHLLGEDEWTLTRRNK